MTCSTIARRRAQFFCRLMVVGIILTSLFHSHRHAAPLHAQTNTFTPTDCNFNLTLDIFVDYDLLECGFVTVPENHSDPNGPTIDLGIAIIKSTDPNPEPDPIFMLQGGPGGSSIDTFLQFLFPDSPLRANRDIVLFDQRGTLNADPNLICFETVDLTEETIEQELGDEEELQLSLEAMQECRERLLEEGIDLSAYDSLENAADINAIVEALGYEQINLYGVSYGTLLALHTMREHPDTLRSVILDAVVPTQTNFVELAPRSQDRAFRELFEACETDSDCNATYPNLEEVFFETVTALDEQPTRIQLTDNTTGLTYNALFDGASFLNAIFQLLYVTDMIPALPKVIYDARDGEFTFLAQILPVIYFDRTFSIGMYYSVVCAEDADIDPANLTFEDLYPEVAEDGVLSIEAITQVCEIWDVEELNPSVDEPVTSEIPTLLLSGRFDPITPPAFAELAASTLEQSYLFTFPTVGHGAAMDGECPASIIHSFLEDPELPPDATCIDEQADPTFFTPNSIVMTDTVSDIVTMDNLLQPGLLLLSIFLLLSLFLIWPMTTVIRLITQRTAKEVPAGAHMARWIAALNALLAVVFLIIFVTVVGNLVFSNESILFFGLPRTTLPLFILPLLVGLLTAGMLVMSARAWMTPYWSVWNRLYYTILTIAALGCVTILTQWGLLQVFF
ncbi:MAG: alpha/beta hydrolase [Chloroflexota bacterium]